MAPRIRRSLRDLEYLWTSKEDVKPLETFIRALHKLSLRKPDYDLPPEDDKSYFRIAGFHGEPFEGPGKYYGDWWGGYCHHNDVLFPTWHRAYLYHFENALREVPGCDDLALPFWDELVDVLEDKTKRPIPKILTTREFEFTDGTKIRNPLFSYKLKQKLVEVVTDANNRYSKHEDYQTVRYPLSGLVGTEEDRKKTAEVNAQYTPAEAIEKLNSNVYAWIETKVVIDKRGDTPKKTKYPDVSSILARFLAVFNNSDYTAFSNKKSMEQELKGYKGPLKASIEDPHNAIHLAVGGFFQQASYNANPIRDANGDMGDNETAAFDPIFFLHHCFIDYVFDLWQKKFGYTEPGSLKINKESLGAFSQEGSVGTAPKTALDENYYLVPFRNPNFKQKEKVTDENPPWLTTRLVTNTVTQLGYKYDIGSLTGRPEVKPVPEGSLMSHADEYLSMRATPSIDRSLYPGSFVIKTFAKLPSGREFEINREAILSRYNLGACSNCQSRLTTRAVTPISEALLDAIWETEKQEDKKPELVTYSARITHRNLGDNALDSLPIGGMFDDEQRIPVEAYE